MTCVERARLAPKRRNSLQLEIRLAGIQFCGGSQMRNNLLEETLTLDDDRIHYGAVQGIAANGDCFGAFI